MLPPAPNWLRFRRWRTRRNETRGSADTAAAGVPAAATGSGRQDSPEVIADTPISGEPKSRSTRPPAKRKQTRKQVPEVCVSRVEEEEEDGAADDDRAVEQEPPAETDVAQHKQRSRRLRAPLPAVRRTLSSLIERALSPVGAGSSSHGTRPKSPSLSRFGHKKTTTSSPHHATKQQQQAEQERTQPSRSKSKSRSRSSQEEVKENQTTAQIRGGVNESIALQQAQQEKSGQSLMRFPTCEQKQQQLSADLAAGSASHSKEDSARKEAPSSTTDSIEWKKRTQERPLHTREESNDLDRAFEAQTGLKSAALTTTKVKEHSIASQRCAKSDRANPKMNDDASDDGSKIRQARSAHASSDDNKASSIEQQRRKRDEILQTSCASFEQQQQQQQQQQQNSEAVCRLTARTRSNQCALHGVAATTSSAISPAASSADRKRSACDVAAGSGETDEQVGGNVAATTITKNNETKKVSQQRESKRGTKRKLTELKLASWPLARHQLSTGSFGDCEHMQRERSSASKADRSDYDLDNGFILVDKDYYHLQTERNGRRRDPKHRRPFGQPYEQPQAGWLANAIGVARPKLVQAKLSAAKGFRRRSYDDQEGDNDINIILQPSDLVDIEKMQYNIYTSQSISYLNLDRVAAPVNFKASPIMKGNVVPNSHAIHKTKPYYTQRRTHNPPETTIASGRQSETTSEDCRLVADRTINVSGSTTSNTNKNITAKLNLANCLLDQDYNITVQLFIKKSALNWNFNSFTFDALCCGRSLTELLLHLLDYYNLVNIFKLDTIKVLKCCRLLEFGYHSTNPYHNSVHAADVTQAMHCFIQENKIKKHMTHLEILCSIFAAVCHDLDHPGVNQSFLKATNNPLSSLYDNNSVLENHHWRFALCIFKEAQIFDHFPSDTLDEMRDQLKHLILATDIARQNEYLKRFRELTSSSDFSMQKSDHRSLVLQMALKCADLGNPCRPWLISRVWSDLICEEFYRMGQVERELGIPLTPICQRETTCIAGIQADFFRFIVLPLLELWHDFLRSRLSAVLMSNFDQNYKRWQRANGIVQQLRRRKSVACFLPVLDDLEGCETENDDTDGIENPKVRFINSFTRTNFSSIKRASSNYIKSGNSRLELIRDFQLDRIIEKSPMVKRLSRKIARQAAAANVTCADGHNCPSISESYLTEAQADATELKKSTHTAGLAKSSNNKVTREKCPDPHNTSGGTNVNSARDAFMSSSLCPGYRQVLSPIEDGETVSPDINQEASDRQFSGSCLIGNDAFTTTTSSADIRPPDGSALSSSHSHESSTSASRASSACSSPVMQRSFSSRTPINQSTPSSNIHHQLQQHIKQQRVQHSLQSHPFSAQYYDSASGIATKLKSYNVTSARQSLTQSKAIFNNNKRRESDPGSLTDSYGLAAAIVHLIHYQNSSIYHKRRSSLPICVPKRRSSK